MDTAWWRQHLAEARQCFAGRLASPYVGRPAGVEYIKSEPQQNSGLGAIALAAGLGAQRIVLLGYDAQHTGGVTHWHGDHPAGLGNACRAREWPAQAARLAAKIGGVQVLNASRATAINCWPRVRLEDVL